MLRVGYRLGPAKLRLGSDSMHISHIRKRGGEKQFLEKYLLEVMDLAKAFAANIGTPSDGDLVGLFHDFGK